MEKITVKIKSKKIILEKVITVLMKNYMYEISLKNEKYSIFPEIQIR